MVVEGAMVVPFGRVNLNTAGVGGERKVRHIVESCACVSVSLATIFTGSGGLPQRKF